MDKVQFNTEVINTRKLVKRVKVLIVHALTRQVLRLRQKKGSEQQVLKNQRRATRFVAEVEAIKDLKPDFVTKKAVTSKKNLQEVLNNPKSSARDRVLARVTHHRLIQERVIRFRGMVTRDLLRTGTKKYRRLRKSNFEAEADARLKEEKDYQVTLEEMMRDCDDGDDDDDDDNDDDDDDDDAEDTDDSKDGDEEDDEDAIGEDRSDGEDSNAEDENQDSPVKDGPRRLNTSRRDLHKEEVLPSATCSETRLNADDEEFPHQTSDGAMSSKKTDSNAGSNTSQLRGVGKRKLDSMFLGSMSSLDDEKLTGGRKEQPKSERKGRRLPEQRPKVANPTERITKGGATRKVARKVPMVDQPNAVRPTQGEKMIPGINCHPELPMRESRRDPRERSSRKPFPSQPHGKQLPSRQPPGQSRQKASYPTAATKPPPTTTKPAAKEVLHPSWEASKKRKEELKIVPFQGKKITFDDD